MKWVYVAHPYGGQEKNKAKVEAVIKQLVVKDPNVFYVSPIHAVGHLYNDVSYMLGMQYCFELLKRCEVLILCEGWEKSTGCNMEKDYAERHNIPITYEGVK